MKLNNSMRDNFIDRVLGGLTKIDYISQVQELVNKESFEQLPDNLKNKDTIHYLDVKRIYFEDSRCMGNYYVKNKEYIPSDKLKLKVKDLHALYEVQREKLRESKSQLHAIIYNVSTLKKAKEVVPEDLHKYLPVENEKPVNNFAVVTTELMDNLKSLGLSK